MGIDELWFQPSSWTWRKGFDSGGGPSLPWTWDWTPSAPALCPVLAGIDVMVNTYSDAVNFGIAYTPVGGTQIDLWAEWVPEPSPINVSTSWQWRGALPLYDGDELNFTLTSPNAIQRAGATVWGYFLPKTNHLL